ncbi:MAG: hypothetical protein H0T58_12540 [Gemmatimonadales bacterium]|nr:hypothetical protein [Gemmatimonadales bacterium]
MVRWCAARTRRVGAIVSLSSAWDLAEAWYSDRLDPRWRRRTPAEAQEVFNRLGLTDPFWNLSASSQRDFSHPEAT